MTLSSLCSFSFGFLVTGLANSVIGNYSKSSVFCWFLLFHLFFFLTPSWVLRMTSGLGVFVQLLSQRVVKISSARWICKILKWKSPIWNEDDLHASTKGRATIWHRQAIIGSCLWPYEQGNISFTVTVVLCQRETHKHTHTEKQCNRYGDSERGR